MASNNSSGGGRRGGNGNRSKNNQSTGNNQAQASRSKQSEGGIGGFIEAVKQRPLASAAIAAGAAGASAFLWAKRSQITDQITELTGSDEQAGTGGSSGNDLTSGSSSATTGTRRRGRPSKASLDSTSDDQTEVGAIAYGA